MTNALDLIRKVGAAEYSRQDHVVYCKEGQRSCNMSISGLRRDIRIRPRQEDGFFRLYMDEGRRTQMRKLDHDDVHVHEFLDSLPIVKMVLARPVGDTSWLAVPENPDTATARGVIGAQIVMECDSCTYFDHVISALTRDGHLIFKEVDYAFDDRVVEDMRTRFLEAKENLSKDVETASVNVHKAALDLAVQEIDQLIIQRQEELRAAEEERRRQLAATVDGRIRLALEETGARHVRHTVRRGMVDVTWRSQSGRTYNSVCDAATLDVISAGLCLSGEDAKYDLTSLIGVVHEGENRGRIVAW